LLDQDVGKIVCGLRVIWVQAQAFFVFLDRFIKTVQSGKRVSEVAVSAA